MNKEIKNTKIPLDKDKKLKIISLGGMYEIGKNTWVYECENDIMLIDAGLAFPSVGMIGVDIVLPKLNYLLENREKIKALVVTHGHEDHIGGIIPLFREIDIPIIYGPNLAMGLLKGKFQEAKISFDNIQLTKDRTTIEVGSSFSVTYLRNNHSIADSFSLIIDTPAGRVFHTGDFKIDHSPIDNLYFDVASIARAGEDGVNLLISDSTNAEKPGYTPSEKVVTPKLKEIINNAKRRTYITTFASQVLRIKIIIDLVLKAGKKLALFGRSMINLASISKDLGYMNFPEDFVVRQEDAHKIPPEDLVVLCTGSQGEQFAALSRIARNEHKYMKIQQGDVVVMSASPIPGNEKSVNNLVNSLFKRGAEVVYGLGHAIHVSGHASQEEQKMMINLVQPDYFMPCHGEYRMLVKHGQTGVQCGVDPDKILIADNGDVMQMQDGKCQILDRVEAGIIMVDNANVGELDSAIMLERRMIASEGALMIVMTINAYGELMDNPKVYAKGIVLSPQETKDKFLEKVIASAKKGLETSSHKPTINSKKKDQKLEPEKLKIDIRSEIHDLLDRKMNRHPLLEVILMEYTGKPVAEVLSA
jgi:ribonuclease J